MSDLFLVEARSVGELCKYQAAWDELAEHAVEPNVFYHSDLFLPAWEHLGEHSNLCVLLMFDGDIQRPDVRGRLAGFFPIHFQRAWGLPLKAATLWKHSQCFFAAPLMRAGFETRAYAALFDWLGNARERPKLFEVDPFPGDGPTFWALTETLRSRRRPFFTRDAYTRATYTRAATVKAGMPASISTARRKRARRLERKLANGGRVEYEPLGPTMNIDAWLARFLQLERSGWKGESGTALDCTPATRDFFLHAARNAHTHDRLHGFALLLDGVPIAMTCDFRHRGVNFGYKSAYDERHGAFSPGTLLELENLRRITRDPSFVRFDSCSDSDSTVFKQLLDERRPIVELTIAIGRAPGDLAVSLFPLLRWVKRSFKALTAWK
jgi:CelD/BcsL family acetyltransferase involved in cellulose biosynthesis